MRKWTMKKNELKTVCESLIDTFNDAGKASIDLYAKGLKIETKEDNSPVSNGDLKVNELITNKIKDANIILKHAIVKGWKELRANSTPRNDMPHIIPRDINKNQLKNILFIIIWNFI